MASGKHGVVTPSVLALVLTLVHMTPATAFWFFTRSTDNAQADGKPVDDRCVSLGEAGACEFYRCFEERLPCGERGYMLRFGDSYCRRFETTLPAFTQQGQVFINETSQCLTRTLLPYYRQSQVDCHRLSHAAFDAVSSCYAANGFCQVVEDNVAAFADVFRPRHLFQTGALKIWKEILEVTYHCDPDRVHSFANYVFGFMSGILRYFTSDDK